VGERTVIVCNAAIEALGELRAAEGREWVLPLLQDKDVRVRRAAAGAAGKLAARPAIEPLLTLVTDADPGVRRASLDALRLLREPRAVPLAVAALGDRQLELKALECLGELGGPEQAQAVAELAKRNPSVQIPAAVVRVLTEWRGRRGVAGTAMRLLIRSAANSLWHAELGISGLGCLADFRTPEIYSVSAAFGKGNQSYMSPCMSRW